MLVHVQAQGTGYVVCTGRVQAGVISEVKLGGTGTDTGYVVCTGTGVRTCVTYTYVNRRRPTAYLCKTDGSTDYK